MVLIGIAFYLPFLIFGAFPYNTKTNTNPDEMGQLLEGFESVDFYAMSEFLSDSPKQIQKEIDAFETWEGGKCRFCHAVKEDDRDRMAPSLYGIFGRPAGVGDNYTYSDALMNLKSNGLIWTPELLDAFISNPSNFMPGNRMRVQGIEDLETRKLIVNYLMRESKPIKEE
ncbi:MAG TPA: hypothetical protein QGG41_04180 [Gammaproteobacteria bacterium]|nr:hypothetical protein [Gammaproteobacteria bacterium]